MSSEPNDNTKNIFNAAVEIEDSVELKAYLDDACGDDVDLLRGD